MSSLGSRFIAITIAGILVGTGWFYFEKHRLEQEIRDLQLVRRAVMLGTSPATNVVTRASGAAPAAANPPPGSRPAAAPAGGAVSGKAGKSPAPSPVLQDLSSMLEGGLLRNVRWISGGNDVVALMDSLVPYLELSSADAAALRHVMESTRDEVVAGIKAASTVTRPSEGEFVINVKDSSAAKIAAIKLQDSIKEVLGEARYGIYEGVGAKAAIDNIFNNGLNPVTVTVTRTFNEARGMNTYAIRRQTATGGGGGGGGTPRESLGANLGLLAGLIPEDF